MPLIDFTDDELEALVAVHTTAAKVDWAAYDRAKQRIVDAGQEHCGLKEGDAPTDLAASARRS